VDEKLMMEDRILTTLRDREQQQQQQRDQKNITEYTITGYHLFLNETVQKMSSSMRRNTFLFEYAGVQWRKLSPDEKNLYREEAKRMNARLRSSSPPDIDRSSGSSVVKTEKDLRNVQRSFEDYLLSSSTALNDQEKALSDQKYLKGSKRGRKLSAYHIFIQETFQGRRSSSFQDDLNKTEQDADGNVRRVRPFTALARKWSSMSLQERQPFFDKASSSTASPVSASPVSPVSSSTESEEEEEEEERSKPLTKSFEMFMTLLYPIVRERFPLWTHPDAVNRLAIIWKVHTTKQRKSITGIRSGLRYRTMTQVKSFYEFVVSQYLYVRIIRNTNSDGGMMAHSEIMRQLSEKWKRMDEAEKLMFKYESFAKYLLPRPAAISSTLKQQQHVISDGRQDLDVALQRGNNYLLIMDLVSDLQNRDSSLSQVQALKLLQNQLIQPPPPHPTNTPTVETLKTPHQYLMMPTCTFDNNSSEEISVVERYALDNSSFDIQLARFLKSIKSRIGSPFAMFAKKINSPTSSSHLSSESETDKEEKKREKFDLTQVAAAWKILSPCEREKYEEMVRDEQQMKDRDAQHVLAWFWNTIQTAPPFSHSQQLLHHHQDQNNALCDYGGGRRELMLRVLNCLNLYGRGNGGSALGKLLNASTGCEDDLKQLQDDLISRFKEEWSPSSTRRRRQQKEEGIISAAEKMKMSERFGGTRRAFRQFAEQRGREEILTQLLGEKSADSLPNVWETLSPDLKLLYLDMCNYILTCKPLVKRVPVAEEFIRYRIRSSDEDNVDGYKNQNNHNNNNVLFKSDSGKSETAVGNIDESQFSLYSTPYRLFMHMELTRDMERYRKYSTFLSNSHSASICQQQKQQEDGDGGGNGNGNVEDIDSALISECQQLFSNGFNIVEALERAHSKWERA
jgi:hypothetical protein